MEANVSAKAQATWQAVAAKRLTIEAEAAAWSKGKAAWEAATIARLTTEAQTRAAAKYYSIAMRIPSGLSSIHYYGKWDNGHGTRVIEQKKVS